eukprot:11189438-Lingulodinium_polyedra.AAC.1
MALGADGRHLGRPAYGLNADGHGFDADGTWTQVQTVVVECFGPLLARSDRCVRPAKLAILRGTP